MKILSVGNSFSVDCQRYVRDIAKADKTEITLGNLYIGGCSLERHCENLRSAKPEYEYFFNNKSLGSASIQTALKDEDWDVVTLQQASHFSGMSETYFPYIEELSEYIRRSVPTCTIYINQTWAYEYDSTHGQFPNYNCDRRLMHERLTDAYEKAARVIGAEIIPVGKAVSIARERKQFDPEKGGIPLSRDGFHLSYKYGRLLAGYVWYKKLCKADLDKNSFLPADYEYIGRDSQTDRPLYREIEGTRADADLVKLLKICASQAIV